MAARVLSAAATSWRSAPFNYRVALVRALSPSFAASALRGLSPGSVISQDVAVAQHAAYVKALSSCVESVIEVPHEGHPDSCFIEDTAVAIGDTVLLTRPGSDSRSGECSAVGAALDRLGVRVVRMPASGSARLDGGDVVFTGSEIFVGVGSRSNLGGCDALAAAFPWAPVTPIFLWGDEAAGRRVRRRRSASSAAAAQPAPPSRFPAPPAPYVLHLKSLVSAVAMDTLLFHDTELGQDVAALMASSPAIDRRRRPLTFFPVANLLVANALPVNGKLIVASGSTTFPEDHEVLRPLVEDEKDLVHVNMSELAKADGALTCCSLLLH